MGCVGWSGHKKVTINYMKPGGFRFWSRSLLLVHLVLVLPSHAVLLLCKWSSCCTSFSWCWCCLCVGRGCCWTCLTETGSKSEQKSQAIANKIHAPFRSLTLCCRSRCFLLLFLGVPISVLLAARSLSSDERLSSTSIRQSRTHDGKRKCTADLDHEQHRREMNSTHVRRCLHDGRSPLPVRDRLPRLGGHINEQSEFLRKSAMRPIASRRCGN